MKKLLLTLTLAATTIASADLTPTQFGQVRDWAHREGYFYRRMETAANGIRVYVFENPSTDLMAYAPVSSDTPDEAINALIASNAIYNDALIVARQLIREAKASAQPAEEIYRRGYIDGSQLRQGSY